jgi:hypothetical protein
MPDLATIDPAELQQVETLCAEGLDCSAIGRIINRSREWVAAVAQQLELAQYERSGNPTRLALLELYRQGCIQAAGFRDGQIVWKTSPEAHG